MLILFCMTETRRSRPIPANAVSATALQRACALRGTLTSIDVAGGEARQRTILFTVELHGQKGEPGWEMAAARCHTCMKTRFHSSRTLGSSLFTRAAAFLEGGRSEEDDAGGHKRNKNDECAKRVLDLMQSTWHTRQRCPTCRRRCDRSGSPCRGRRGQSRPFPRSCPWR